VADAIRRAAGAQASIINNGSIRRGLPGGAVSYGALYEMQPFQNAIYRVEVTGAQLRAALENAVATGRPTAHLAGMTAAYDSAAPQGSRIRSVRLDGGRELADADRVTLGLTEFMAEGGERYTSLAAGRRTATGLVDLNVLIDYMLSLPQPVQGPAVGRWLMVR
jgi:5'-nucleotidase